MRRESKFPGRGSVNSTTAGRADLIGPNDEHTHLRARVCLLDLQTT